MQREHRPPPRLRVAMIGCGRRAHEHLDAIASLGGEVEVSVLCDTNADALQQAQKKAPDALAGANLGALLADRPCEVAVLCLRPSAERRAITEALASANGLRAVLVEKPAAASAAEARDGYRDIEVPVFVFHQMRLLPWAQKLRSWVREHPAENEVRIEGFCYGTLFDQGLHLLDLVTWLEGGLPATIDRVVAEQEPARVSAQRPLPIEWRLDTVHPGPIWTEIESSWGGERKIRLGCGPLATDAADWLGKRLRYDTADGWIEFHAANGLAAGGTWADLGWEESGSPAKYLKATASVYVAMRTWLLEDGPEPDLPTLDEHVALLTWCERALDEGNAERLSRPAYLPPGDSSKEGANRTGLSVVIPLTDHRGFAEDCVRSWTQDQEGAADDFRLVLISNRDTEPLAEQLRPLLRPEDLLLSTELPAATLGQGDMDEYARGIEATDDEWIFLSEPHCLAQSDSVREMRRFFAENEAAGFCAHTIDGHANGWGKMEALFFDEGFAQWSQPGHWAKMIIRGFGIRRQVYEAVGGLRLPFGRFSEWLLAADLHRAGYYLEYDPRVRLLHHYTLEKPFLDEAIEEFVSGQARYLSEIPLGERTPYYPDVAPLGGEVDRRWARLERRASKAAAAQWGKNGDSETKTTSPRWEEWLPAVHRARIWRDWGSFLVQVLAQRFPERAFPHFQKYYNAQVALCFDKHLPHLDDDSAEGERVSLRHGRQRQWTAEEDDFRELPGFSSREQTGGEPFCWTGPVCGIPAVLPPGRIILEIDLVSVLATLPEEDVFLLPGRRLGRDQRLQPEVSGNGRRLRFTLPKQREWRREWLALAARPIPPSEREPRTLGLPVARLRLLRPDH